MLAGMYLRTEHFSASLPTLRAPGRAGLGCRYWFGAGRFGGVGSRVSAEV